MGTLFQEINFAAPLRGKAPGFALFAGVPPALGIGANTAIFSVVNGVLLHKMPYADPARLAIIWNDYGNQGQSLPAVSPPDYQDYRQRATLIDFASASGTPGGTLVLDDPSGGGNRPRQFDLATVTPNFFPCWAWRPRSDAISRKTRRP